MLREAPARSAHLRTPIDPTATRLMMRGLRHHYTLWSPLPPGKVLACIERWRSTQGQRGHVGKNGFWIRRSHASTGEIEYLGTVTPAGDGTLIDGTLQSPGAALLLSILFFPYILIWMYNVTRFPKRAIAAQDWLQELTESTASTPSELSTLQKVRDPGEPGAESAAPWSLHARHTLVSVRFRLRDASGPWQRRTETLLEVRADHLRLRGCHTPACTIPWHTLTRMEVQTDERGFLLVLHRTGSDAAVEIRCAEHPATDLEWLVAYLETRRVQHGASPEEATEFARRAKQLRAMTRNRESGT